jgi:hypothetical protein
MTPDMDKEFTFGTKETGMSGSGLRTPVAEKDSFGGQTGTTTLEVGRTIKEKALESNFGLKAKSMRDTGKMTKNKDKDYFYGLTATNTKANSLMARFMALES